MRFTSILSLALPFAQHVSAQLLPAAAAPAIGIIQAQPAITPAPVLRREVDQNCFSSVGAQLAPPKPSDTALISYISNKTLYGCETALPASLSSAFKSYYSEQTSWLATLDSKNSALNAHCGTAITLTLSSVCNRPSLTYSFTVAGNRSASVSAWTVAQAAIPTKAIIIGSASGLQTSGRLLMACVGTVAAVFVLYL